MAFGRGGSCQREALPALTHQVFSAATSAWQGVPSGAGMGTRFGPGVNRWKMDVPLP